MNAHEGMAVIEAPPETATHPGYRTIVGPSKGRKGKQFGPFYWTAYADAPRGEPTTRYSGWADSMGAAAPVAVKAVSSAVASGEGSERPVVGDSEGGEG